MNIGVVCFDFAGSGLSEGEYVSLGYYEKEDLVAVVDHLRSSNSTTRIGNYFFDQLLIKRPLGT